jgi:hypothetical protein
MDSECGAIIMYSNAQYYKDLSGAILKIKCDINGVTSYVPIDPANTDYQNIMKLVAEGKLVIAPADE